MSDTTPSGRPYSRMRVVRIIRARPRLFLSALLGLAVFAWSLKNQATEARDRAREATAIAGARLNEARLNESRYLEGLALSKLRGGDVELAELRMATGRRSAS